MSKPIQIGLLGAGVVGSGVIKILQEKESEIERQVGAKVSVSNAFVKDKSKKRDFYYTDGFFVDSAQEIFSNPELDIVVELMGGEEPAYSYINSSLQNGKHVVTANKEVMAKYCQDILSLAKANEVRVMFESSVGGGTPVISPLIRDLLANDIHSIRAIINGTTNYILTRMASEFVDYPTVLHDAQALGYAESDPTNDVEGIDAAYKLAILSTLGFRCEVKDTDVYREGITRLSASDFVYADELGFNIKLLAMADRNINRIQARVHPVLIGKNDMLAKVDGVLNAVEIDTDLVSKVLFHGPGAGALPTGSAVVADVVNISRSIVAGMSIPDPITLTNSYEIASMNELSCQYYIRLNAKDEPGVLAQISSVLGVNGISISSFIQKDSGNSSGNAELVIMTHLSNEKSIQSALVEIGKLPVVNEVSNTLRVLD